MPTTLRKQCEGHCYHVYSRGVGRKLIFEDQSDREFFLILLERHLPCDASLYAWCLMDNHFHLLIRCGIKQLSDFMRNVQSAYAYRFNRKHNHAGHVFQGRFGSQPVRDDFQLLATVRYIHQNPVRAGFASCCEAYKWSSYCEYVGRPRLVEAEYVLEVAGGLSSFIKMHQEVPSSTRSLECGEEGFDLRSAEEELLFRVGKILGENWRELLASSRKQQRDQMLVALKRSGLSIRQIERISGIGRNIIARAK